MGVSIATQQQLVRSGIRRGGDEHERIHRHGVLRSEHGEDSRPSTERVRSGRGLAFASAGQRHVLVALPAQDGHVSQRLETGQRIRQPCERLVQPSGALRLGPACAVSIEIISESQKGVVKWLGADASAEQCGHALQQRAETGRRGVIA